MLLVKLPQLPSERVPVTLKIPKGLLGSIRPVARDVYDFANCGTRHLLYMRSSRGRRLADFAGALLQPVIASDTTLSLCENHLARIL